MVKCSRLLDQLEVLGWGSLQRGCTPAEDSLSDLERVLVSFLGWISCIIYADGIKFTPKSVCCGTIQFGGYLWTNQRALLNLNQLALHDDNTELTYEKVDICPFAIVRHVKKPVICANLLGFELYAHKKLVQLSYHPFPSAEASLGYLLAPAPVVPLKGSSQKPSVTWWQRPNISPSFAGQLRQLVQAPPESPSCTTDFHIPLPERLVDWEAVALIWNKQYLFVEA